MVNKESGSLTNARKQKLHTKAWQPVEAAKAVLVWHHGFGEYVDRFDEVFTQIAGSGIAVFSFDAHGHGDSEPLDEKGRGFVNKFQDLVDDGLLYFDEVEKKVQAMKPTPPVFVGGNSLGGLVASFIALGRQEKLAGLVLQSPAIDVQWNMVLRVQAAMGNLLAALVPFAKLVPAVRPEDMSQDPERVKAYVNDPKLYQGNVKARSGNEILKGFKQLQSKRRELKLPIYATHGTSDRCTSLPALREMLKHVSSKDVTLQEVEGAYHELLHGPETPQVVAAITAWLLQHATAAPAPAPAQPAAEVPVAPAAAAAENAPPAEAAPAPAPAAAAAPEEAQAAPAAEAGGEAPPAARE